MSLTIVRLTASLILFIMTLLIGTVPVYIIQFWSIRKGLNKAHKSVLSSNFYVQILTQIGGGVLFYTVFVHMIPEIRDNFENYIRSNDSIFSNGEEDEDKIESLGDLKYPYLELAISSGFFGIYLIEELVHKFLVKHDSHKTPKENSYEFQNKTYNNNELDSECNNDCKHIETEVKPIEPVCEIETQPNNCEIEETLFVRFLHGLVIVMAFSVHSLFDGIAIGIKTTTAEVWTMFIAISAHKLLVSFIISVEVHEQCNNMLIVGLHMTLFSLMSPIGIWAVMIGEKSIDNDSESNPVVILLSAMASGTIIYIVFFEILQKERASKVNGIVQLVSMLIGFGLMFCVTTTLRD